MKRVALTALSLLFTVQAFAVSEKDYSASFDAEVAPFYKTGKAGEFKGVGGVPIRYRMFVAEHEKGALVIVNGFTETYVKFAEVIYDLSREGYSIYILDHRGQGFSGRMRKNPRMGYVRHFSEYVTDLKTFVDTVVNAQPHTRRFVLSHSMGGAITALYLAKYPKDFDAAAFSAPMHQINTSPYPEWMARFIANMSCGIGLGGNFAPGQGNHGLDGTFAVNRLTHSEVRYNKAVAVTKAFPEVGMGGASNRWVQQSLRATTAVYKNSPKIQIPVLLLQASEDKLVKLPGQNEFCKRAQHCVKIPFPGAFHELLQETDAIRDRVVEAVIAFFASNQ